MTQTIFERLGVRPVINASGIYTDLGGSRLSPSIWAAMAEANDSFIDLVELLDRTGQTIAGMLGVEAARITPGASAAIALGIGACLTGDDREKMEGRPKPPACRMRLFSAASASLQVRSLRAAAGSAHRRGRFGCGHAARRDRAGYRPKHRCLFVPPSFDGHHGAVPLTDVGAIGRERGIPTFVDAAYMNYPTEMMGSFNAKGADLVSFSAKYFGGPNGGGLVCGAGGPHHRRRRTRFHPPRVGAVSALGTRLQDGPPGHRGHRPRAPGMAGDGSRSALAGLPPPGRESLYRSRGDSRRNAHPDVLHDG